ncbi:ABC transporter substrate-binding protein [Roseomonas sp. OT10]|uniref:ABC transporter substrate-binding protein n=1 Tax=Roseomonas cutis TaxID=2897332 RepID=UPI001E573A0D|nr:ABC transporter substrate-binding protein [Roseomonas sp. OT10]UFN48172.1 ABC transporter substrate-binding protein [Roseomonas sp. OT10]
MRAIGRRAVLAGAVAAPLAAPVRLQARGDRLRIGEVNSHGQHAGFLDAYRKGWTLAEDTLNARGGVLGARMETLFRDDSGRPEEAARQARLLVQEEGVALLAGGFLSHIGLALSEAAEQSRRVYLASEPLTDALVWSRGNRFTFRLRPNTYMQASMLAEEAAKLPATRWTTVAPNYEYGQSAVRHFRERLRRARPEVQFVGGQYPALGRFDDAVVPALAATEAEAVFNACFGEDLAALVRNGQAVGLFEGRSVVSLLTGEPEYLDPLGEAAPEGWIVTGYPEPQLRNPVHDAFRAAYLDRWGEAPRCGSVIGHDTVTVIAATLEKAGGTETEALIAALSGLRYDTAFGTGTVEFRAIDHQATLGTFVGRTAVQDRRGLMVDWRYADGANHLPPDDVVRSLRPHG